MCLIITGSANQVRNTLLGTKGLLEDIYQSNSDGVGVMYRNRRGLRIIKVVPKHVAQVEYMLRHLPDDDRNLAIHFRMTTHGKTNLDNCHPYDVVPGRVAMMHNGVLACGNDKDPTRSDTYHFIEEYLKEVVAEAPKVVHRKGLIEVLGDFIGNSNRFVFMDDDGEMSIVNRDTGVEYKEGGLWFSNTYAWNPSRLLKGYRSNVYRHWRDEDDFELGGSWAGRWSTQTGGTSVPTALTTASTPPVGSNITPINNPVFSGGFSDTHRAHINAAMHDGDADRLGLMMERYPYGTMRTIYENWYPVMAYDKDDMDRFDIPETVRAVIRKLNAGTAAFPACMTEANTVPYTLAKIVCTHIGWSRREAPVRTNGRIDVAYDPSPDDRVALDLQQQEADAALDEQMRELSGQIDAALAMADDEDDDGDEYAVRVVKLAEEEEEQS